MQHVAEGFRVDSIIVGMVSADLEKNRQNRSEAHKHMFTTDAHIGAQTHKHTMHLATA